MPPPRCRKRTLCASALLHTCQMHVSCATSCADGTRRSASVHHLPHAVVHTSKASVVHSFSISSATGGQVHAGVAVRGAAAHHVEQESQGHRKGRGRVRLPPQQHQHPPHCGNAHPSGRRSRLCVALWKPRAQQAGAVGDHGAGRLAAPPQVAAAGVRLGELGQETLRGR